MALRMSEKQARRWVGATNARGAATPPRRSKFNAARTVVDGFRFASRAEARRYSELLLRGLAGELRNLELQPRFELRAADGTRIATYIGDFRYQEPAIVGSIADWRDVVEDVKGVVTPVYRLKRRLFEATYGRQIVFREISDPKHAATAKQQAGRARA